jgi:hypothetical protein
VCQCLCTSCTCSAALWTELSVWRLLRSYNARYAARLDGWEAARMRDLAAHAAKAQRAFCGAGGDALAQQLLDRVRSRRRRTVQRPAGWQPGCMNLERA